MDAALSFDQHVSAVVRSCFFQVRFFFSKVRSDLTRKAANSRAASLILSQLDYCNSLLACWPQTQIKRLQAAQNAAARTVAKCRKTYHITPFLRQLHWLPVRDYIHHKFLSATYMSVHGNAPLYLSELLHFYTPSCPSDLLQDLSLMSLGQEILKQNDTVSEPSGMLLHLSGMHYLEASGKVIPFSPSNLL